ncbi:UpxY family transcription antiterminator [Pedobacter sp. D749]|uniref:UpxY family transcription antiterminator n=1 Tax=Pedobacter sp. D749 TaxID=2856523 RepID=UPI001C5935E2|nr:UpxY family transcription antiterminator [Pedobacter sp. D749]QXU43262.1 UpxY family transcription antiterminator [Pedobacter sp. D749]
MNNSHIENFSWFVIYTFPNYERKVYSSLEKKKITAFLPLQKITRQWSDRKKIMEVPLFPNYIFLKIKETERFAVLDIQGVKYYLSNDGRPIKLSEIEIEQIQRLRGEKEVLISQKLEKGAAVIINSGPFMGMTGILFEKKGKTRFGILIHSMNQTISIVVPSTEIGLVCE